MQHLRTIATASLLALASLSGVALAAGYDGEDGDLRSDACNAIACADGARECAKVAGSLRTWIWMPLLPYAFALPVPVDTPFTFSCYEKPMQ